MRAMVLEKTGPASGHGRFARARARAGAVVDQGPRLWGLPHGPAHRRRRPHPAPAALGPGSRGGGAYRPDQRRREPHTASRSENGWGCPGWAGPVAAAATAVPGARISATKGVSQAMTATAVCRILPGRRALRLSDPAPLRRRARRAAVVCRPDRPPFVHQGPGGPAHRALWFRRCGAHPGPSGGGRPPPGICVYPPRRRRAPAVRSVTGCELGGQFRRPATFVPRRRHHFRPGW
jgi:hypothetical protein